MKHEFKVEMTCGGCSRAVEQVLKKAQGVDSYHVDLEGKKVEVVSELPAEKILEIIKKTGKATVYVGTN